MKWCALLAFFGFSTCAPAAEPLALGAPAPDVKALDATGTEVQLGNLYQKGWTLVYFYPKADTPGCTAEACGLRDAFAELTQKGIQVVGVSSDKVESQKKFADKYHLPFTLLADTEHKVADAFGVPHTLGFTSRQSFLIKGGKIVWRDLKASTKEQAADVLKAVGALGST